MPFRGDPGNIGRFELLVKTGRKPSSSVAFIFEMVIFYMLVITGENYQQRNKGCVAAGLEVPVCRLG